MSLAVESDSRTSNAAAGWADPAIVRTLAINFQVNYRFPWHAHAWHQLVFARQGVVEVHAEAGFWVVPPHRAVWIPAGMSHTLEMVGAVELRSLYFLPDACGATPDGCHVLSVSRLLRELILEVIELKSLEADTPRQLRLQQMLLDELSVVDIPPLELPLPTEPAGQEIAEFIRGRLDDPAVITKAARRFALSRRTLERRFQEQVGVTLGKWVQLARLIQAVRLLGQSRSVTDVALDVGYESVSAFIAAFKRQFGVTPSRYSASGNVRG